MSSANAENLRPMASKKTRMALMKSKNMRQDMGHPCLTPLGVLNGSSSEALMVVVAHKYTEMIGSINTRGVLRGSH